MNPTIVVTTAAMAAANGLDTLTLTDSVRAGISMIDRPTVSGQSFFPLKLGSIPDGCFFPLKPEIEKSHSLNLVQKRILLLAGLLEPQIRSNGFPENAPLIIGLPQDLEQPETIFSLITEQLGLSPDVSLSKIITSGRAGGLMAVIQACSLIDSGKAELVIAGGIDSYNDIDLLGFLHNESRIKTATSIDSFIPGEGASLLVLMTENLARRKGIKPCLSLTAGSTGSEEGHSYSRLPCRGDGLSRVFSKMFNLKTALPGKIRHVFSSMNGESFWAKEWGIACVRNGSVFDVDIEMHHPAEYYGDPGAASGPLMIGCVLKGFEYGYLPGPVLVYASSDHESRAAVLAQEISPNPVKK